MKNDTTAMALTQGSIDYANVQRSLHNVTDCIGRVGSTSANSRILHSDINHLGAFNANATFFDTCDVTDCVDDEFEGNIGSMKCEKNRLDSFRTWPVWSVQSPNRLAEAGLYYSGQGDKVVCAFCYGILKSWNAWDIPLLEHTRHFPRCPFVLGKNVRNIPIGQSVQKFENYPQNGDIQKGHSVPRVANYPETGHISTGQSVHLFANPEQSSQPVNLLDFTREANRLATFSRWPPYKTQTPESLARAGFYHVPCAERTDRVQCAYCNGKLFNWAETDNPWTEHARCFPKCPYVKLCVDKTVNENPSKQLDDSRNHDFQTTPSANITEDVTSAMSSAAVMAVMEMGFTSDQVKKVLDKRMESGRELCLSAEQMATEILENEDSSPSFVSGSNSTSSHSRSREINSISQSNNIPRDEKNRGSSSSCKGACHVDQSNVGSDKKTSESKGASWKNNYLCSVCSKNQKMVTFLPCGHLTCCNSCSMTLAKCPICQTTITGSVRTFY